MKRFNANVGSTDAALQETPEVLKAIGVDSPIDISSGVVNNFVCVIAGQPVIGKQGVSVERGSGGDVLFDFFLKNRLAATWDYRCAHFAAPLKDAHNGGLVLYASSGNAATLDGEMHVASLAAYESFVGFDFATIATQLDERTVLHCLANPMQHEPSGLLGYSQCAVNLVRTNTVLAIAEHPYSGKPFLQTERRIFKNGSYFDGELSSGMHTLALPFLLSGEIGGIVPVASWTLDTIRPTLGNHVSTAVFRIGEVDNCFLQSANAFHSPRLQELP